MPGNQIRDLIMFITQNGMKLPLRRRQKEFSSLIDAEVLTIEKMSQKLFLRMTDVNDIQNIPQLLSLFIKYKCILSHHSYCIYRFDNKSKKQLSLFSKYVELSSYFALIISNPPFAYSSNIFFKSVIFFSTSSSLNSSS